MLGWIDWMYPNNYQFPASCHSEVGTRNVKICETNVNTALQLAALSTVLQTLTQAQIFDAYLYLVSDGSNTIVGIGESIVGLTALAVMLPAASIVDKCDRGRVCDYAAYFAYVGALLSVSALWLNSVKLLLFSMTLWGLHWELCNSASDCIFVDSLPIVARTDMISKKTVIQMISCSFAIFVQLCFFFLFGNTWSIPMCKVVLTLGYVSLTPLVMNHLFVMKDRRYHAAPLLPRDVAHTLQEESIDDSESSVTHELTPQPCLAAYSVPYTSPIQEDGHEEQNSPLTVKLIEAQDHNPSIDDMDAFYRGEAATCRDDILLSRLTPWQSCVPYLVGGSDFVRAVGAGMTVKFFALFFMNEYSFSPVHVTCLGIIYNLTIALFTEQANAMSMRLGRSMTSVLYQTVSLVLFFVLYQTYTLPWVILIYLVRGAAGNAFSALDRAIVADTTTVKHRGKWMAVESLSHVTWSGSAFIGGMLSDCYDYRTTFLYTAGVYGVALIIYLPVAVLFPKSCDEIAEDVRMDSNACKGVTTEDAQTLRATHEALSQSRMVRDSMSMSRARGTSVIACMALDNLLHDEEYSTNLKPLSTREVIGRRSCTSHSMLTDNRMAKGPVISLSSLDPASRTKVEPNRIEMDPG